MLSGYNYRHSRKFVWNRWENDLGETEKPKRVGKESK